MKNIIIENDNKFKSIYISYSFIFKIENNEYSKNAVLTNILAKGCNKYKTEKEIEEYLAYLYGTAFDIECQKLGDLYNVEFKLSFVNKKFLPNKEDVLNNVLDFLYEIIYNPLIKEDKFNSTIFEREKENILEKIISRKDDKLKYGVLRAEELLCENERFSNYIYGTEEDIKTLTNEDIEQAYNHMLDTSNVNIIITGNLDGYENIKEDIENKFKEKMKINIPYENLIKQINEKQNNPYREVIERVPTMQSVIGVGLRCNNVTKDDIYTINVFNSILGGTPSSKLFQNVREKESLAYTTRSRYNRFKDYILMYAGIEEANFKKCKEVMFKQLDLMRKGEITDIEIISSKESLVNDLKEYVDSKIIIARQKLINLIEDDDETIEEAINKIKSVTIEDVVNIAKKIELNFVYLLGGENNGK